MYSHEGEGGSSLRVVYKTFLIYRTCMRPAPDPCLRLPCANLLHCCQWSWPARIHVVIQHQATLCVPNVALETPHFILYSSHSTLHTSHLHFTLHTPHFISSHLDSSRLISAHLISSHLSLKFFSAICISSEECSTFLISSKLFLSNPSSSLRQKAFAVREKLGFDKHRFLFRKKTIKHSAHPIGSWMLNCHFLIPTIVRLAPSSQQKINHWILHMLLHQSETFSSHPLYIEESSQGAKAW